MPRLVPVEGVPALHTVPRAQLTVRRASAVIELDDTDERRFTLMFSPLQALRVLTADLYLPPGDSSLDPRRIAEVTDSEWLAMLADTLAQLSPHATFMEQARHWVVPAGDEVIEVVAWALELG